MARKTGNYVPDLSFGTHFFQDLVEANIRYLPLYPDDPGALFQEAFLRGSSNLLPQLLPEYKHLAEVVRVVDVAAETGGEVLKVLLNAELGEAVGLFGKAEPLTERSSAAEAKPRMPAQSHWRWRMRMARKIAEHLDPERFGVKAMYVFGSAKNASAQPGSDLDLIVHIGGSPEQLKELRLWFEAWSLSLAESNFLRTGYKSDGLLDVHYITDEDVAKQTSFAAKIKAATDAAQPLPLRSSGD